MIRIVQPSPKNGENAGRKGGGGRGCGIVVRAVFPPSSAETVAPVGGFRGERAENGVKLAIGREIGRRRGSRGNSPPGP